MTRKNNKEQQTALDIKNDLKTRMSEQIDRLFEELPENSSLAEIEQILLKESPKLTSHLFQALVDRQDFPPSSRTQQTQRIPTRRAQEK